MQLKNKISIYVPSTMHDKPAPENVINYYVNDTLKKLSIMFGGATATTAAGAWFSESLNKVITEKVTICYAFCESYNRSDIVAICDNLKNVFMQECISVEFNNTLEFI